MLEGGGETRLPEEALPERGVAGELGRDHLESDRAIESRVSRPVDDAHAAAAGDPSDLVAGEGRAFCEVGYSCGSVQPADRAERSTTEAGRVGPATRPERA